MTRVYTLALNGENVLEIDVESPAWLPVEPRLNRRWLKSLVITALAKCFRPRTEEEAARVYLN